MNVHSSCSRCPFVDSSTLGADYFYLKCGTDTVSCTCLRKKMFISSTCSKCSRRIQVTSELGQRTFLVVFAEQICSSCQHVASVQANFKSHRSFCRADFFILSTCSKCSGNIQVHLSCALTFDIYQQLLQSIILKLINHGDLELVTRPN